VGLRREGKAVQLVRAVCEAPPPDKCAERSEVLATVPAATAYLRVRVDADAMAQFSYSLDNKNFIPAGQPFKAGVGRWVGAQLGLFSTVPATAAAKNAWADIDYFRITP
jgi:hypothetical protein